MNKIIHSFIILCLFIGMICHPTLIMAEEKTLDSIAYENLTYKDIFIINNHAYLHAFDNGNFDTYNQYAGVNTVTNEAYYTGNYSLKAFGSSSQQIVSNQSYPAGEYFIASKVLCLRYVKGYLGVCPQNSVVGIQEVTDDFVTSSDIINMTSSFRIYIGSIHSANLDGYVDNSVVINMNIFENKPTSDQLTQLYEEYLEIEKTRNRDELIYTNEQMSQSFINYMNEKVNEIGLMNTNFVCPVGVSTNKSTVEDVMKLLIYADSYEEIHDIWSMSSKEINVLGNKSRKQKVTSTVIKQELEQYYHILGGKTGTLGDLRNLSVILEIPNSDDRLVVVALKANGANGMDGNRYQAVKEIADIAMKKYEDPNYDVSNLDVCCQSAIAGILPTGNVDLENIEVLYSKNKDERISLASISKVMTAICLFDIYDSLDEKVTFNKYDITTSPWYGKEFYEGDTLTLKDALYAMLLPSSDVTAWMLGRSGGEKLLKKDGCINHKFDDWHKEDKKISRTCKQCGEIEEFNQLSLPSNYGGTIVLMDEPENLYVGTHNIAEVLNIKEGTFTNGEITIQIDGTNIHVEGTTSKTIYFDLQTGTFGITDWKREPGYRLNDGDYRFGLNGEGKNMPNIYLRTKDGKGNTFTSNHNQPIRSKKNLTSNNFGLPYLYMPIGEYEYSGNLVLVQGTSEIYDNEISCVQKLNEIGEYEVNGYLWSANNVEIYGKVDEIGFDKEKGKIVYSTGYINIYLPQEEGFLQIQMNLVDSKAINAYGWRLNMMYACDNQFNILFPVTQGGEYEAAITLDGRDDFMGMGAHGSEVMFDFDIHVDGKTVDLSNLKELTDFTTIRISRTSDFYDPQDEITKVAIHEVVYDFDLKGVTVSQKVEWSTDQTCKSSYMAMFPVRRKYNQLQVSDTYFDDYDSTEYDVSESGFKTYPTKWTHGASKLTLYSKQSGVTATLELLESTQCTKTGYKHIANNDSYNKMYFTIVGVGNTKHDVKANDVWVTKSRYEVKLEEGLDKCNIYGHTFNNYVSDSNATYEQDGTKTSKCEHCDQTNTIIDKGSKIILGDIDGNGKVNTLDRMYLSRHLAHWSGYETINTKAADVNLDGEVNAMDRMILARHLAHWQGYESLPYIQ